LERHLSPISAAVIVPVFALSATGVSLAPTALLHVAEDPISRGVAVGLVAGKFLGVPAGAWLAVRLGAARLPDGVRWRHLVPLGLLAGIGYTVSLLLARLALDDPGAVEGASTAILTASIVASALALVALRSPLAAGDTRGTRRSLTRGRRGDRRAVPIQSVRRESDGTPAGGEEPHPAAGVPGAAW
ncbi:Na+/H+ antiporter NhaA, partial [Frankia gtarii]